MSWRPLFSGWVTAYLRGVSSSHGLACSESQLTDVLLSCDEQMADNEAQATETLLAGGQSGADAQEPISCLCCTAGHFPQDGQSHSELMVPGGDGKQQVGSRLLGRRKEEQSSEIKSGVYKLK